MYCIYTFI